ncbi:MAG: DUF1540 domain-containing protein [Clostridia bacterium]
MTKLKCHVQNCIHNNKNLCKLDKIKVEGPGACTADQTCCYNFLDKNSAENSSIQNRHFAVLNTNIECKAENCKYNRRCKCIANEISVDNLSVSPCVMGETECHTFSAR